MQTSNIYLDSSKYQKQTSNIGLLSTAISKLGDSSIVGKSRVAGTTNVSPVRMRLFRESPQRKQQGLDGFVVGNFFPKKVTQVTYSSAFHSSSPLPRSARLSPYRESPQRAQQNQDRYQNWNSRLDIQLQLQNHSIAKIHDSHHSHESHLQYKHQASLGERLNRIQPSVAQGEIQTLHQKLASLPRSEILQFSRGHQQELNTLHQTISRIMKTSQAH
ncbi:hypothetical protein pb186bvf_016599 [Paramecium bursaria]